MSEPVPVVEDPNAPERLALEDSELGLVTAELRAAEGGPREIKRLAVETCQEKSDTVRQEKHGLVWCIRCHVGYWLLRVIDRLLDLAEWLCPDEVREP